MFKFLPEVNLKMCFIDMKRTKIHQKREERQLGNVRLMHNSHHASPCLTNNTRTVLTGLDGFMIQVIQSKAICSDNHQPKKCEGNILFFREELKITAT